jgi:hypothetical protein
MDDILSLIIGGKLATIMLILDVYVPHGAELCKNNASRVHAARHPVCWLLAEG